MSHRAPANPIKRFVFAFTLTACLAGLWGFGHQLHGTLVPLFADIFRLHGMRFALTQSVYNLVYVLGAIPAALYARRFGYKAAILLGLGFVAVGAFTFYPAAETLAFSYYLIATVCMAQGWLTLEVAANPLLVAWGTPEHAVFRLNLAQCLFPIGSIIGIVTARWLLISDLALPQAAFAYSIAHPYIVLGACVLLLAFVFEETGFPPVAQDRLPGVQGIRQEIRSLLARPLLRFAMLSLFCSVVAVGMIWTLTAASVRAGIPHLAFLKPSDGVLACMGVFGIGRLIGTALLHKFPPSTVLLHFALGGIVMAVLAAACGGMVGVLGVLGLSFALSITWPTILGLAIEELGQEMKMATALLAGFGALGAVTYHIALTVVGGMNSSIELAITALCFAVIARYARACAKTSATSASP